MDSSAVNASDDKTPKLNASNAALLNSDLFATKVKIKDLFNAENVDAFGKHLAVTSQFDPRVLLLPTNVVAPCFVSPNMVLYKGFKQYFIDKLFPITACITKTPLFEQIDAVYRDNDKEESVYKTAKDLADSVPAHTGIPWSGDEAHPVNIECTMEGKELEKDEALLVFIPTSKLLHMLANQDMILGFAKSTECGPEITLNKDSNAVPIRTLYSAGKGSQEERYSAASLPTPKYVLGLSNVVMFELQCIHQQMFALEDDRELAGHFESRILTMMSSNHPGQDKYCLGIIAASRLSLTLTSTMCTSKGTNALNVESKHALWSLFVAPYIDWFGAMSVNGVKSAEGRDNKKLLNYTAKSSNPLTNLQVSGCRGSKTIASLVLFLIKRLHLNRSPGLSGLVVASKGCSLCEREDSCAINWVTAFTRMMYSAQNVSRNSNIMPSSASFQPLLLTEYNNGASFVGNIKENDEANPVAAKKAGVEMIKAHGVIVDEFKDAFPPKSQQCSNKEAIKAFFEVVLKIRKYVQEGRHGHSILHRDAVKGDKMEAVINDNEGYFPKLCMGFHSLPLARSMLVNNVSRYAAGADYKLKNFEANPTESNTRITTSIAAHELGLFASNKDMDQVQLRRVLVSPVVDQDTEQITDINSPLKEGSFDVQRVLVKSTSNYKMLVGMLQPKAQHSGGIEVGNGGCSTTNLKETQYRQVLASIEWVLTQANGKPFTRDRPAIEKIIRQALAPAMTFLPPMMFRSWKEFLPYYAIGCLMHCHGYILRPNNFFVGITVPKFAMLTGAGAALVDPVSQEFLVGRGATMTYVRCQASNFQSNTNGVFCRINLLPYHQMPLLIGTCMLKYSNVAPHGIFAPISAKYSGAFGELSSTDELMEVISVLASKSLAGRCSFISKHADLLLDRTRQYHGYEEVGFEEVSQLLISYNAEMFINDPNFQQLLQCLDNNDAMVEVCAKAEADEDAANVEENDKDFDLDSIYERVIGGGGSSEHVGADDADNNEARAKLLASFKD